MRFLKANGEWVRWLLFVAAICAMSFLDVRYVTKATYETEQGKLRDALANMATAVAVLQQTSRIQDDHESRLRLLERSTRARGGKGIYEDANDPVYGPGPVRDNADLRAGK